MGNNIKINNEIYGTSVASEITYDGGVSGLEATNTQDAIDELAYSIKSGESDTMAREVLASTLTQLGVPTSSDSSFITINENIMILAEEKYDEGNEDGVASAMVGDATVDNVLSGKTFTTKAGVGLTGTMVNQGTQTSNLNCGDSYTIPAGYHNGSGKVTANTLASQTSATATAADILSGKTAWVNGNQIAGTRRNIEFQEGTTSYSSAPQWSGGSGSVTFKTPFSKTPKVAFRMAGQDCRHITISASTTGFSYSFINATGNTISCSFQWIALVES